MLEDLVALARKNAEVAEKREDRLASAENRAFLRYKMSKQGLELEKLKQENFRKRI